MPLMFIYGGSDLRIRVQKSMEKIQNHLTGPGSNCTVLYFGPNGHALYRDDLSDLIARWITDGGMP